MSDFFACMDLRGFAFVLLAVGASGLVIELFNPGVIVPGLLGAVCLVYALFLIGSVPLWIAGLLLLALLAGVVLLAMRAASRKVTTGAEGLVGEEGVAETDLADTDLFPGGTVFIHGEIWRAIADRPLPKGTRVRVTAVNGLTLSVIAL
jgi:membrane-bound serine protease (ClpP class)